MTFISGDVSEGSENDKRLISILGANWRELTRQDEPIYEEGGSRYDFLRCVVLSYLLFMPLCEDSSFLSDFFCFRGAKGTQTCRGLEKGMSRRNCLVTQSGERQVRGQCAG